jgi:hypothetical protein
MCRKAAGKCLNTRCQPIEEEAELYSSYMQKHGKCPSLFSEDAFLFTFIKVEETVENVKKGQRLFSYFCFSQPYHF